MTFNGYQEFTNTTDQYPHDGFCHIYLALGLNGEAGEIAEKVKKCIRDHGGKMSDEIRLGIALELGDVLWYTSQMARRIGFTLEEIASMNMEKLQERVRNATIHGDGDNR